MDQGTFGEGIVRKGLGAEENVLLGRAGSEETGQKWGMEPEGWVTSHGDSDRFQFPSPQFGQG